jgi:flagellar hook-length control protein FliK
MSSTALIAQSNSADLAKQNELSTDKDKSEQVAEGGFMEMFIGSMLKAFGSGGLNSGNSNMGISSIEAAEAIAVKDRGFLKNEAVIAKADVLGSSEQKFDYRENDSMTTKAERSSENKQSSDENVRDRSSNEKPVEIVQRRSTDAQAAKPAATVTAAAQNLNGENKEISTEAKSQDNVVKMNDFVKNAVKMAKVQNHGINKAEVNVDLASKANLVEKQVEIKPVVKSHAVKTVATAAVAATAEAKGSNAQNAGSNGDSGANANANANAQGLAAAQVSSSATASKGFVAALNSAQGSSATQATNGVNGSNANISMSSMTNNYTKALNDAGKSAEAKAPLPTTPSKLIDQVVKFAKLSMVNGKEEIKMILKPGDLGWMKVRLAVNGNKVTAQITVENEQVKTMLESNLSQLQNTLQSQNLKINNVVITVNDLQNQDQNANHNGDKANNKGKNQQREEEAAAEAMLNDEDGVAIPTSALTQLTVVDIEI